MSDKRGVKIGRDFLTIWQLIQFLPLLKTQTGQKFLNIRKALQRL